MGKRNRDGGRSSSEARESRRQLGGIRYTERFREVARQSGAADRSESRLGRADRLGFFDPVDWSALELLEAPDSAETYRQESSPRRSVSPRVRLADASPVRPSPARRSAFGFGALADSGALPAGKGELVRKAVVTHPPDSTPSRVERPRCKSRPKKSRGKGGSRSFIPWCGR